MDIDDASTDNSLMLLREYQKKHPKLQILQNATNQGPVRAINKAIAHARGGYLIFAAADDQILPGFFELGIAYLSEYPEAAICCSNISVFRNEKPYKFCEIKISNEKKEVLISADELKKKIAHTSFWIPTNASLYRRDLVLKAIYSSCFLQKDI